MRFQDIKLFHIDNLLLDENNYRFKKAEDQKGCIERIYNMNKTYFYKLMESLAKDNLGELLLVYADPKKQENIVLDGNRRLSALKVLYNPNLAPTPSLSSKAIALKKDCVINFEAIGAQVSDNRSEIMRTVYERHASTEGSRRQSWSAQAAARFRYFEEDNDPDWRVTCLLLEVENQESELIPYIENKFSYETFKRIVKQAFSDGVLNTDIFKSDEKGIHKRPKENYQYAINIASTFIHAMRDEKITLSRKGNEGSYADEKNLKEYLATFSKAPIIPEKPSKEKKKETDSDKAIPPNIENSNTRAQSSSEDIQNTANKKGNTPAGSKVPKVDIKSDRPWQLPRDEKVVKLLNQLGNKKLGDIYNSITTISCSEHTELVHVGGWMLFEILSKYLERNESSGLDGFIDSKINIYFSSEPKDSKKDIRDAVKFFTENGNRTKHSTVSIVDPNTLLMKFRESQKVIASLLKEVIEK